MIIINMEFADSRVIPYIFKFAEHAIKNQKPSILFQVRTVSSLTDQHKDQIKDYYRDMFKTEKAYFWDELLEAADYLGFISLKIVSYLFLHEVDHEFVTLIANDSMELEVSYKIAKLFWLIKYKIGQEENIILNQIDYPTLKKVVRFAKKYAKNHSYLST